jgi:hypothetical protein
MNLGKYLFGINESYLDGLDEKIIRRQIFVYNVLSFMLLTLVFLVFIAGTVYGVVIFGNWFYAIFVGLVLSLISFIILLLVFFLNMTTKYRSLYDMMTNMENVFKRFYGQDLTTMTDEEALVIVEEHKLKIAAVSVEPDNDFFHLSKIFTSAMKVVLILIISIITANGIELLMFSGSLNESFKTIKNSELLNKSIQKQKNLDSTLNIYQQGNEAEWTLSMLEEKQDNPFHIINTYSILLAIDVMDMSLGNWKILLDLLFSFLFLTPFILVKKSKEFSGGAYQREVAIHDICTSYLFFLLSQRECQRVKHIISNEYDFDSALKVKYKIS